VKVDHFLDGFFRPESVAVVGATNNPFKPNFRLLENLVRLRFEGRLYPINPSSREILGVRAFPRLSDVPERPDLVISAVPAAATLSVARECDALGIRRLIIVSGGFSEAGNAGGRLQSEIAAFVRSRGIRTVGPNTLSPINTGNRFVVSYMNVTELRRGGVSLGFQSGLYEPKLAWLFSQFGVNLLLDTGNKMDVNEIDVLEYFHGDPETSTVALHMESLRGDGRSFFQALRKLAGEKPTIILKSGRTGAGSRAAASHTGAMAKEDDAVFDAMLRQSGAMRAANLEDFFDLTKAFSCLRPPRGDRMAVITMSGGEGVLATDALEANGFKPASLGPGTREKLKRVMPPWEIPVNPFDVGVAMQFHFSDLPGFTSALAAIPEDNDVDCVVMQLFPNLFDFTFSNPAQGGGSDESAKRFMEQLVNAFLKMKDAGKPLAFWQSSLDVAEQKGLDVLELRGVPVFHSADRAVRAMAALREHGRRMNP
jgi:acetate---CoA ligase (ADP-forming)